MGRGGNPYDGAYPPWVEIIQGLCVRKREIKKGAAPEKRDYVRHHGPGAADVKTAWAGLAVQDRTPPVSFTRSLSHADAGVLVSTIRFWARADRRRALGNGCVTD